VGHGDLSLYPLEHCVLPARSKAPRAQLLPCLLRAPDAVGDDDLPPVCERLNARGDVDRLSERVGGGWRFYLRRGKGTGKRSSRSGRYSIKDGKFINDRTADKGGTHLKPIPREARRSVSSTTDEFADAFVRAIVAHLSSTKDGDSA
jgi:hypothetical protein